MKKYIVTIQLKYLFDFDFEDLEDIYNNCDFLDGCNLTHTFKINNHDSNQYSYIKIRQIGENSDYHDRLVIGSIEFYGYLITNLNINI